MRPDDMDDPGGAVTVLPSFPPGVANERRREARCAADLPLRLTSGTGETIPAVIRNLSASGLLAAADVRFSLLLPPPDGARFDGEFFLDDVEVGQLLLEIVRVERHNPFLIGLGCQFVQPSPTVTAGIRAKVASLLAAGRRS